MTRWGIIGAGKIARRFAASLTYEKDAELYVISGRSEEKLKSFQQDYPCKKVCTGFDDVLEDDRVDAVYIALPHAMHKEWSLKAMEAHKAVLCEKPAVLNEQEMREIIAVSKQENILYMEAMKPRFTPGYRKLKEITGELGEVVSVYAEHCSLFPEERIGTSFHTLPGKGGCLLDTGCYCVSFLADFLTGMPVLEHCEAVLRDGVDWYVDAKLAFDNGEGRAVCAFDRKRPPYAEIVCTGGKVIVERPHRPDVLKVTGKGREEETIHVPYEHDDFYGQIHHFHTLLKEGKTESDIMSLADSLRVIRIMDLVRSNF